MAMDKETIKLIQQLVGADADGIWGPKSKAAFDEYLGKQNEQPAPAPTPAPEPASEGPREYTMPVSKSMPAPAKAGYFDSILSGVSPTTTKIMNQGRANSFGDRIAELEAQLAEVRRRKAALNTEEDMGKYKFVYDADPSTYMTYKQGIRTAKQTEDIRKATEDATKASNAQNLWNQLSDKREVAEWAVRSAENKFAEAERSGNTDAMKAARDEIERYTTAVKKLDAQQDQLRKKFMKELGVVDVDVRKDPEAYAGYDERIGSAISNEGIVKDLGALKTKLDTSRKAKFTTDEIKATAAEADREIPALRDRIEKSNMSDAHKAEMLANLDELDKLANDWRGTGANKPKPKYTPEEEKNMYQKALDKLATKQQLVDKGYQWLKKASDLGCTHKYLQFALDAAAGKK